MVIAMGWVLGVRGCAEMCNVYRVSILQDEKVLQICCMTVWIYLTLLDCTPEDS